MRDEAMDAQTEIRELKHLLELERTRANQLGQLARDRDEVIRQVAVVIAENEATR